jgi:hypothetical protein
MSLTRTSRRKPCVAKAINDGDNVSELLINEMLLDAMADDGGLRNIEWDEEIDIREMITTSQGSDGLA